MDKPSSSISPFPATVEAGSCSARDLVGGLPTGGRAELDAVRRELAEAIDRVEEVLKRFEALACEADETESAASATEEDVEASDDGNEPGDDGLISVEEARSFVKVEAPVAAAHRRPPLDPALAAWPGPRTSALDATLAEDLDRALAEAFEEAGESEMTPADQDPSAEAATEEPAEAEPTSGTFESSMDRAESTVPRGDDADEDLPPPLGPLFLFKPAATARASEEKDKGAPAEKKKSAEESAPKPGGRSTDRPEGTIHVQFKNGGYTSAWSPSATAGSGAAVPPPPPSVLGFSKPKPAKDPKPPVPPESVDHAGDEDDREAGDDVALPS